ncbi:MAG: biotin/lipoate A/B protein ligase family protein [Acutalibacteraceae bacterium]
MSDKILFMTLPSTDPVKNLAAEEELFLRRRESFILLWRNKPCVIIGRNQDPLTETTPLCRMSVPVVRRCTGGGAVYHDLNNVNFSFIQNGSSDIPTAVQPILDFLQTLHLPVEFSGRNDILLHGKKISGCAQRQSGGRTLTHGTLLFRRDVEKMQAYLSPPAEKLLRHGVASVRSRTGELAPYLPQFRETEDFMAVLAQFLQGKMIDSAGENGYHIK